MVEILLVLGGRGEYRKGAIVGGVQLKRNVHSKFLKKGQQNSSGLLESLKENEPAEGFGRKGGYEKGSRGSPLDRIVSAANRESNTFITI